MTTVALVVGVIAFAVMIVLMVPICIMAWREMWRERS
jgi:hypothetical protein